MQFELYNLKRKKTCKEDISAVYSSRSEKIHPRINLLLYDPSDTLFFNKTHSSCYELDFKQWHGLTTAHPKSLAATHTLHLLFAKQYRKHIESKKCQL